MTTEPITSVRAAVTVQIDGKAVAITLGGGDEHEVVARVRALIANYPDETPASYPFAQAGRHPEPPTDATPEGFGA